MTDDTQAPSHETDADLALAWKNRIIGHSDEDPASLLANLYNFRIHTGYQQAALQGVLDAVEEEE